LLPGTNHWFTAATDDGRTNAVWSFYSCRLGTPAFMTGARTIPPASYSNSPTNWMASLQNVGAARIETPFYPDGIGTLYFDAINVFSAPYTNQVVVEIATNMYEYIFTGGAVTNVLYEHETEQFSNRWEIVTNVPLNRVDGTPYRYQFTFNYRHAARLRIRKAVEHEPLATLDNYFVAIDNIRVSRPPSNVALSRPEVVCSPGYPATGSGFTVRCVADNAGTNAYERTWAGGGINNERRLKLFYRWRYLTQVSNNWSSVDMTHVPDTGDGFGNGEMWQGSIPSQPQVGDFEYYYATEFKGYRYKPIDYTESGYTNYWTNNTENSESLSPGTFRGGVSQPDGREFYMRLRPYPSRFGAVSVVTGPVQEENPIQMTLVSNDLWRGMVPVGNGSITNLLFCFKGEREYVTGNNSYSSNAVYWAGAMANTAGAVPFGGVCGDPQDTPPAEEMRIRVAVTGGGYVQVLFNVNTLEYMTSRAEYQNFNAWSAPPDVFTDSDGQASKKRFMNTFDAWPENGTLTIQEFFVGYPSRTNVFVREPYNTFNGWLTGSSAYTVERNKATGDNTPSESLLTYRNVALQLEGGSSGLGLGYVHNTENTLPDGMDRISFKARLSRPANPFEAAYYKLGFADNNYTVRLRISADPENISPGNPTISVFGYYSSPDSFYEYRITQVTDFLGTGIDANDNLLRQEIWKWTNGVPVLLKAGVTSEGRLRVGTTVELRLYNDVNNITRIKTKFGSEGDQTWDDTGAVGGPALRGGTVALMSSECRSGFTEIYRLGVTASATATGTPVPILPDDGTSINTHIANWSVAPAGRWVAVTNTSGRGIYAAIPSQSLGLYLQPTQFGTSTAPAAPGTQAWALFRQIPLTGFGYSSYDVPVYMWRSQFAMLQVMGRSDGQRVDIVVDELDLAGWRGQESSDLSEGENAVNNQGGNDEWVASEAWVVATTNIPGLSEGRVSGAFNTTRVNPMSDVQLSTRYANTDEGWVTNTTVIYTGRIYLDGMGGTNVFAVNFKGNARLDVDGEIVEPTAPGTPTTNLFIRSQGWYPFELRLGCGADGAVGPVGNGAFGGFGVAYSRNAGQSGSWTNLADRGDGSFLRTDVKRVSLNLLRGGKELDESGNEGGWLDQAIRSPRMDNGTGMLEFDYQVIRAPVKLSVQFAPSTDSSFWTTIRSVVVSNAMEQYAHELAYLGTNIAGYLRVLNERGGGFTNGWVDVKSAVVWDEPVVSDTDWRAYNVKVTDRDPQRVMLDESKFCALNNSQTSETDPAQILEYDAFIKTPLLPTGLGSLTFMARAYSNNQAAAVSAWATTHAAGPRAPFDQWTLLQEFAVTNRLYETFTYTPPDGRPYRAVKLAVPTTVGGGGTRVCVEELAVSEPVFPGFDISDVKTLCVDGDSYSESRFQPLHSDNVGIEARLMNFRLGPQNIRVFVDYYVGTNFWGVENWPAGEVVTVEMHLPAGGGPATHPYRTTPLLDIPPQEKNTVVQYRVRATYEDKDGIRLEVVQKTFENPSQYYPIDLNQAFASSGGWSPYYIVYDVPVGAVWINEVNAYDEYTGGTAHLGQNKYIEIAVPAAASLVGWHVDLIKQNRSVFTITLPAELPELQAVTNGYAFFVIGHEPSTRPNKNIVPPLTNLNYGVLDFSSRIESMVPGGIRLRRPLGMNEHFIAYDMYPSYLPWSGAQWVSQYPEKEKERVEYVGVENNGGSLSVVSNSVRYALPQTSDWVTNLFWTPGLPNVGQAIEDAILLAPGTSNVVVTSTMSPFLGTQNGKRVNPYSFKIRIGDSTNIVYVADDWYRVKSVKVNGEERMAGGETNIYNLVLGNVQTNLTVQVAVGLRGDVDSTGLGSDILEWLMGFGDAPFAPTWYGRDPYVDDDQRRKLSIVEQYWIDANPTVTNYLRGGVVGVVREVVTSNYFVTVALDLNGNNVTNLLGDRNFGDAVFKVEARQPPYVNAWHYQAQFKFNEHSFDANHRATVLLPNPFLQWANIFSPENAGKPISFRWVLEYEDGRFSKPPLVSTNAPSATP
jgi:hypothetical protein